MGRTAMFLGLMLLACGACAPTLDTCQSVMPLTGDGLILTTAPGGRPACRCQSEGVTVVVELKQVSSFSWTRGRIWIDDVEVGETDFSEKLAELKARKRAEIAIAEAKGTAGAVIDAAKELATAVQDAIK